MAAIKQAVEFIKCSPAQNMTILVLSRHPAEAYPHIAAQVMAYDSVHAEQVGFVEAPGDRRAATRLHMAGGEFCGNACMALAAYLASEEGMRSDDAADIVLEASGAERLLTCRVRKTGDDYRCRIDMPVPEAIDWRDVAFGDGAKRAAVVRYPGALHLVVEAERFDEAVRRRAQKLVRLLGAAPGAGLVGVMLFNPVTGEMAPLVYIPSLGSMIWERGCGSGTASVGAYLAWKRGGAVDAPIRQPGGTIRVYADYRGGAWTSLAIEGAVGIVARGRAFIEDRRFERMGAGI